LSGVVDYKARLPFINDLLPEKMIAKKFSNACIEEYE